MPKARGDNGKMSLNLCPRLFSEPSLEATCYWSLRVRAAEQNDLATGSVDSVSARPCLWRLDAHSSRLATKQNFACSASCGPPQTAKACRTPKLIENPRTVTLKEYRYVNIITPRRLDDINAVRTNAKP